MQVTANSQPQTVAPAEGLIADKSAQQSVQEAFASVLAKAGLNFQAGVSAGMQAPASLAPAIERPERPEPRESKIEVTREASQRPQAKPERAEAREDKAQPEQSRAADKGETKAERTEQPEEARKAQGKQTDQGKEPAKVQEKADAPQGETTAKAQEGDKEMAVAASSDQAALVAQAEEGVVAVLAAFAGQAQNQGPEIAKAQTMAGGAAEAAATGDEGPALPDGVETAMVGAKPGEAKKEGFQHQAGPKQEDEAVEQAALLMAQAGKGGGKAEVKAEGVAKESGQDAASVQSEQAAQLSKIVGDQGEVKVEVGSKSVVSAAKSAGALSVGVLAAEAATQEQGMGQQSGFGQEGDFDPAFQQRNPAQTAQTAQTGASAQNAAQAGVAAPVAQGQSSNFQAALATAQAGGDGAGEIQGVQNAQTTQSSAGAQPQQAPVGQTQASQEARAAAQTQHAEKPHEARAPQQSKEILDQINVKIAQAAKEGLDKITVQMRPEALGRVEVQLKLGNEGQLSALIVADKAETLEALKRDASQLEKSLADAGFKTDSGSLQFSLRGEQQNNRQQAAENRGNAFFERGQALDEAPAEQIVASARPLSGQRSGVDIKV